MTKYIINKNTKEIHRTAHTTNNCRISGILLNHRENVNDDWQVAKLIKEGYNGCYYCYRSQHND